MDYGLYRTINGLSGGTFADDLFRFLAGDLQLAVVAVVALAFLFPGRSRRAERRSGAVLSTAAAGLALLLNQPVSRAVGRLRPYVAHPHHSHLLIARSHDPSFPSDHATGAFALAVGIWLYDRTLGTVLLALGALLAFSRVFVGTHYPGDVVAGAAIGTAVAYALFRAGPARRLLERLAAAAGGLWDRAVARVVPAMSAG